jgi:hypothetical protein
LSIDYVAGIEVTYQSVILATLGTLKNDGTIRGRETAAKKIANLFHLRRDAVTAAEHRAARTQALSVWAEVGGVSAAA